MIISALHDRRVNCWSFMIELPVADYLKRIEIAYNNRGGLDHQRTSLRTASGKRIRERMVRDLIRGAVLPPLVIGIVKTAGIDAVAETPEQILKIINEAPPQALAIIDGMQRTTALQEAVHLETQVAEQRLRLEIWLADSTESLIYRMLVLNAGQVPWNLKQQLLVVYEPLVAEITHKVNLSRILVGNGRRSRGGEFSREDLIETYIAFGLRKTEVDTQENLAEEFSKLDVADALAERRYDLYYFPILQLMVEIDQLFSLFGPNQDAIQPEGAGGGKMRRVYSKGRNIFDTQPPRIGFIVSHAIHVLGCVDKRLQP